MRSMLRNLDPMGWRGMRSTEWDYDDADDKYRAEAQEASEELGYHSPGARLMRQGPAAFSCAGLLCYENVLEDGDYCYQCLADQGCFDEESAEEEAREREWVWVE